MRKKASERSGTMTDTVLSSRIRLARNIPGVPFPHLETESDNEFVLSSIKRCAAGRESSGWTLKVMKDLSSVEKRFLREEDLITMEMERSSGSAVFYSPGKEISVLVNEEDHIRIQAVLPGLALREACKAADETDDMINSYIPYAFSDEYGYLTSDPGKLGTAMKASAVLHLPALSRRKHIGIAASKVEKAGGIFTGIMGNTAKTPGNLYSASNSISLGPSEVDIVETVDGIVSFLISAEDEARDRLFSENRTELEDAVWRSVGILSSARKIGYMEALEHLSDIRLGTVMSVIRGISLDEISSLMTNIQWVHLQKELGEDFTTTEQGDIKRADYLRKHFAGKVK